MKINNNVLFLIIIIIIILSITLLIYLILFLPKVPNCVDNIKIYTNINNMTYQTVTGFGQEWTFICRG